MNRLQKIKLGLAIVSALCFVSAILVAQSQEPSEGSAALAPSQSTRKGYHVVQGFGYQAVNKNAALQDHLNRTIGVTLVTDKGGRLSGVLATNKKGFVLADKAASGSISISLVSISGDDNWYREPDAQNAVVLIEMLNADGDSAWRAAAAYALGSIGTPDAIKTLRAVAEKDSEQWLRDLAKGVLEARGSSEQHGSLSEADLARAAQPNSAVEPAKPPKSTTKTLKNDDIEQMVAGGLSDDTIAMSINSRPCEFDTSVTALIDLRKAGVSQRIMQLMLPTPAAAKRKDETSARSAPAALMQPASASSPTPVAARVQLGEKVPIPALGIEITLREVVVSLGGYHGLQPVNKKFQVRPENDGVLAIACTVTKGKPADLWSSEIWITDENGQRNLKDEMASTSKGQEVTVLFNVPAKSRKFVLHFGDDLAINLAPFL